MKKSLARLFLFPVFTYSQFPGQKPTPNDTSPVSYTIENGFTTIPTYTKTFTITKAAGQKSVPDPGDVKEIAEVSINDKPPGIPWKTPFTVDITTAVITGDHNNSGNKEIT